MENIYLAFKARDFSFVWLSFDTFLLNLTHIKVNAMCKV